MPVTFRNRLAVFYWGFTVAWMGGVSLMTHVFLRDGPPNGSFGILGVLLTVFWIVGIPLCVFALTQPCTSVRVGPDGVVAVNWYFPLRVVRQSLSAAELRPAVVVSSRDSEGGPYFRARVDQVGGRSIVIMEGNSRARCVRACERFNAAVFPRAATHRRVAAER